MGRRFLLCAALLALVPAVALAAKPRSWAEREIRVLGHDPATFRAEAPVTRGELAELIAAATGTPQPTVATPAAVVSMQSLDARLVSGLALQDAAKRFARGAKDAGLAPPSRFGSESVARLIGLRKNHPAAQEALERLPADPASRAEAAYSLAQILRFRGWEVEGARAAAETFTLPALTDWQRRVLATAVKQIGYPYVWGGTKDGYDCSGFVWHVYKLQPYAGAPALADTLRGRTTYAMSAEVPKTKRIPFERLRPADVVFFGGKGPRSKPTEIGHMGIYLGNGWMIHSSRYGVALAPLTGWYRSSFAWARRPLAEAGLDPGA